LQMHGYTGVQNVAGGMQAWKAAKLPMVSMV
jgi:rhodanese-related sulfurtransferase